MPRRCVLAYIRISTVEQEKGYGREAQRARVESYCIESKLGKPRYYHESKSGESVTVRHELHDMLEHAEEQAEAGTEVHIIFPGLDRLSRSLVDQETVVMRCMDTGIRIHSTLPGENDTLDPESAKDPMRTAIRQFWGIIHQLERAMIQRRLDGGIARKAEKGGFTGGRTPYGYRSVQKELVIDPEQATIVQRIFQYDEAGFKPDVILSFIQSQFDEAGAWRSLKIRRILQNRELYVDGQYRPRTGEQAVDRPDLIIVRELGSQSEPLPFDQSQLKYPISEDQLALILAITVDQLRKKVDRGGIFTKTIRGIRYFDKPAAEQLFALTR